MGNGRTSETERWSDLEKYLLKPSVNIITWEDIWNRKERRVAERVATTDREHVDLTSLSQGECKHSSPQAAGQTNTQLVTSTTNTCSCWPLHSPPRVPDVPHGWSSSSDDWCEALASSLEMKDVGEDSVHLFLDGLRQLSDSTHPSTHPPTHPWHSWGSRGRNMDGWLWIVRCWVRKARRWNGCNFFFLSAW